MRSDPDTQALSAHAHVGVRAFLERRKPRASVRAQIVFAALAWTVAASILGFRAYTWLAEEPLLPLAAFALAGLKSRFLLDGVATRAVARMRERGREACAGGFLSWKAWGLVLLMVAGGHALRLTALPRPWLGALYATVAVALLLSSRLYWRAAAGAQP